jgi:hypothetical protein
MSEDTITSPATQLTAHLSTQIGPDAAWAPALASLSAGHAALHLAVMIEPFLGWLLDGTKTIESRFSRVRCAPYGCLSEGDIVVLKKTGGPVTGAFIAGQVTSHRLTPGRITQLRDQFAVQIRATDDEFWAQRADCAYATLVRVRHVRRLPPMAFPKQDRRGWVQLTRPSAQQTLL